MSVPGPTRRTFLQRLVAAGAVAVAAPALVLEAVREKSLTDYVVGIDWGVQSGAVQVFQWVDHQVTLLKCHQYEPASQAAQVVQQAILYGTARMEPEYPLRGLENAPLLSRLTRRQRRAS